jgi:hypothetical protein
LSFSRMFETRPGPCRFRLADPTPHSGLRSRSPKPLLNGYAGAAGTWLGVQLGSGPWLILAGFVLSRLGMGWTAAFAGLIGR